MSLNRLSGVLFLLAGLAISHPVQSQDKLGEVLDKGGKLLGSIELRALISGATVSGTTEAGHQLVSTYAADGKLGGTLYSMRGATQMSGTWNINDRGQLCSDVVLAATRGGLSRCDWYFQAGNAIYSSAAENDRNAGVLKHTVRR